jgi:SNF family Na+-dependent transporter
MYFLEMCYGQFLSRGSTKCFLAAPFWKGINLSNFFEKTFLNDQKIGIGFSMIIVSICLANYYSVVIAWVVRYLFSSFRSELVWHKCTNSWNTDNCIDRGILNYFFKP